MRAVCIQPPLVQLNAPYPAVWYLDAWLRGRGMESVAFDHSIALARRVYSREGLQRVFADARASLKGRKHPDEATTDRVRAYFEDEGRYLSTIEPLVAFLSGGDPAFAYRIAVGAGMPMGMRAEAVFGDGIGPDDARAFATATLNDLSDFIAYALDPAFGAVRYAERLAHGAESFQSLLDAARDGWTLSTFYRPILRELFGADDTVSVETGSDGRMLVVISVPFPGCLAGAVAAAQEAREAFGDRATIVAGGGYISTELRFLEDPAVFDTFDFLAYDAGFGALASILDVLGGAPRSSLFHARYRDQATGRVVASGFPPDEPCHMAGDAAQAAVPAVTIPDSDGNPASGTNRDASGGYAALERQAIERVHPDYRGLDFSCYLRVVDSPNPMHRLWNDTPWLKYRLAYGCYWRRCAFCDTQLDYIKRYLASDLDALLVAADTASARTGLYGIHFVDEALPVNLVRAFAARNIERGRPYTFWGNVRFDKAWTDEACAFAAAGGMVAASGGIEIATEGGLEIVDKGFTMGDLVRTLAAFKRSGILVHAYLIYGFPGQSDQDIADSAEMSRVLLAEGLIDSAFWHKFVLTRHSAMYASWERGERLALEPSQPRSNFAVNDLTFRGEESSERWTAPLDAALAAWADDGDYDRPLSAFLPKGLPRPKLDALAVLREAGVV